MDDGRPFEELTPVERRHRGVRLLAQRWKWPDGVVDALIALEMSYPAWVTLYRGPGAPGRRPGAGEFSASLAEQGFRYRPELEARSIEELGRLVAAEDLIRAARPRW